MFVLENSLDSYANAFCCCTYLIMMPFKSGGKCRLLQHYESYVLILKFGHINERHLSESNVCCMKFNADERYGVN